MKLRICEKSAWLKMAEERLLNEYEHLLSDSAETLYGRRRHKLMMTALKKEIIRRMS